MKIRKATINDLEEITKIETICFPESEAASKESLKNRLLIYSEHFWLLVKDDKIISFINGMVTDDVTISDEMFENADLHNPQGN